MNPCRTWLKGDGGYYVFGDLRSIVGWIHHITRLVPDLAVKQGSTLMGTDGPTSEFFGRATDIAIYRNGIWRQYLSATGTINIVYWGLGSDPPIAAKAQ